MSRRYEYRDNARTGGIDILYPINRITKYEVGFINFDADGWYFYTHKRGPLPVRVVRAYSRYDAILKAWAYFPAVNKL